MKIWEAWKARYDAESQAHENTRKELNALQQEMTEYRDHWKARAQDAERRLVELAQKLRSLANEAS
jgi:hypothetical protein